MKLGEALIVRADLQKRLDQIKIRATRNAVVQEGNKPSEDPHVLSREFEAAASELETLMLRINRTNIDSVLSDGRAMVAALAERDVLKLRYAYLTGLAAAATPDQKRYQKSELQYVGTVDVAETQKRANTVAQRLRELNTMIQEANWAHDLVE